MTTAEMIKELCEQMNISVSELARRIGQTPQNFNKKLKRETVTLDELKAIADVLGVRFEQEFVLLYNDEIKISNE
ncbi:TPA: helix-turn-helix domain-containing protein [Streptococcus suis]|nr:helix-turn-helix transcriptional regulator [Streptococcus suis]HEM3672602.1 helix-turn-helix transcriptional regulator [Streptococcus suis]HEM3678651.1 helix-turn-helix transcriptional regulator [Streptococcus suis]